MSGDLTGLVAVIMIFSIPLVAIIGGMVTSVIKAHYRAKASHGSEADQEQLARLSAIAKGMDERIRTLESILDAEVPDWREDHDRV